MEGEGEGGRRCTLVDIQPVSAIIAPEILENRVFDVAFRTHTTGEGLDHQHLCALVGVNIPHRDVRDCRRVCWGGDISGQRPDTHAARMIAVRILDEDVF